MAKRGRKSTFNDKIGETIARLVKDGKTEEDIAQVIGVSRRTLNNWKGKHPELLYAVRESRLAADELVEASLFSRALGYSHPETKYFCHEGAVITEEAVKHYPPDTQAAMFWLRNRQPDRWREKTEGDVNVNQTTNIAPPSDKLSDAELDSKIQAILDKRGGNKP